MLRCTLSEQGGMLGDGGQSHCAESQADQRSDAATMLPQTPRRPVNASPGRRVAGLIGTSKLATWWKRNQYYVHVLVLVSDEANCSGTVRTGILLALPDLEVHWGAAK
jgi:hypothetical protein